MKTLAELISKYIASVATIAPSLLLIGAGFLPHAAAESLSSQSTPRMESTNRAQSAPLNFVNRWFARLETTLASNWSTERLTFRTHNLESITNHEKTLEKLLTDISGGPQEIRILDLTTVPSTESVLRQALDNFLGFSDFRTDLQTDFRSGSDEAGMASQEGIRAAVKAALIRPDVHLHSARILRSEGESRVLILSDDETKDVVVLVIGPGGDQPL